MTVYELARKYMKDEEFQKGGIPKNERKWLDAVGFSYEVEQGCVKCLGEDGTKFIEAMCTLLELEKKYNK